MFECFHEFNWKLKPSKCSFFQSETWHITFPVMGSAPEGKTCAVEEFPMPESFTQVCVFHRLAGHYRYFIKGFAHIVRPLYDVLGKEVKMGLVQLPLACKRP